MNSNKIESVQVHILASPWKRLDHLILTVGLTTNAFAQIIGLKRGEDLYQIKRGNHGISLDLVLKITSSYPNIYKSWLMFGEGSMLKFGEIPLYNGVPFYDDGEDLFELLSTPFNKLKAPTFIMSVPYGDKCDVVVRMLDASLELDVHVGSILSLRRVRFRCIVSGEKYVIVTDTGCSIRVIDIDIDSIWSEFVVVKTLNPIMESYINIAEIKRLYHVAILKDML